MLTSAPVEIERLSHDGRGVARADGKTVFVAGALPGERVRLGPRHRHRHFDEAELQEIVEPSALRVAPRCDHFGVCGGCDLQHLAPPRQLALKQELLLENLRRLGGLVPDAVLPAIPGPAYGYRRRARFGVRYVPAKGRALVGFRELNGRRITDACSCPALVAPWEDLPQALAGLITGLGSRTRLPQIEFAAGDDAAALVFRVLGEAERADIARLVAFGREHGLGIWIQTGGNDSLRLLHGAPLLEYALPEFAVRLQFLPTDFVQVNAAVNRALVAAAVDCLELERGDRVLELFSGIGNFSLALARRAGAVVSVEGDGALVRRARANAAANGLANIDARSADLAVAPVRGFAESCEAVLLDPPRSGAAALVPALARAAPARILYVSCHSATLARDAAALVGAGFRLRAVGVADMFPQTAHAEALALFAAD